MKRLLGIISCFFVLYAVVASVWSSCKQISFESDHHSHRLAPVHAHDHHQASDHTHSDDAVIHCPTLDAFVTVASFSASKERRVERVSATPVTELGPFVTRHGSGSNHGPPGLSQAGIVSPYLLFSVLRI
jgi:hypothetical protein